MLRPAFALATIALFVSAMFDPLWFAERMQGLARVPEQVWWLLGVDVSFYFSAKELHKIRYGAMAQEAARILQHPPSCGPVDLAVAHVGRTAGGGRSYA